MKTYTKEEWQTMLEDSGLPRTSAKIIAINLKGRVEKKEKEKIATKKVLESRDVMEPLDTYKKK